MSAQTVAAPASAGTEVLRRAAAARRRAHRAAASRRRAKPEPVVGICAPWCVDHEVFGAESICSAPGGTVPAAAVRGYGSYTVRVRQFSDEEGAMPGGPDVEVLDDARSGGDALLLTLKASQVAALRRALEAAEAAVEVTR